MSQERLLEVIDSIYAAALDPGAIELMLSRLAAWIGTNAADYYIQESGTVRFASVTGLPEDCFRAYVEHYHRFNPRLVYIQDLREGQVVSDHDYLTRRQLRTSPYFQEFLAATEYREFLGFVLLKDGDWFVGGGVHLPRKKGPPDSREYRQVELLIPHLRRSSQILLRLMKARSLSDRWLQAFDSLPVGVILVDKEASVIRMNRVAEKITQKPDGLTVRRRQLSAATNQQTSRLHQAICQACVTSMGQGFASGGALALERPSKLRPLSVVVAPLPNVPEFTLEPAARAIVLVVDMDEEPETSPQLLGRFFGLTPAESRLACFLVQGRSLKEAAERLQIAKETARNQLKSVLGKTGTHRQVELMALLMKSPIGTSIRSVDSSEEQAQWKSA